MANMSSGPEKEKPERPSSRDLFSRYGGRLSVNQFNQILSRLPMRGIEKEYVKRVMEKFSYPYSLGITQEEFKKGLEEMLKNVRDPIGKETIERIKKRFGL